MINKNRFLCIFLFEKHTGQWTAHADAVGTAEESKDKK